MPDLFYALTKIDCNVREDGTRAQFTMQLAESKPTRFYVNLKGLGALINALKSAARTMTERMAKSGLSAKYATGGFENSADRVLTAAIGTENDELTLAVQTIDGVMSRFIFPTDAALKLADQIQALKSKLDPSSSGPVRH